MGGGGYGAVGDRVNQVQRAFGHVYDWLAVATISAAITDRSLSGLHYAHGTLITRRGDLRLTGLVSLSSIYLA